MTHDFGTRLVHLLLRWAILLALAVPALSAQAADPMSREAFTRAYIEALVARAGPSTRVEPTADGGLDITTPNGRKVTAYLDNAYRTYRQDPSDLKGVLDSYVGALIAQGEAAAATIDRTMIVPVIRDRGWLEDAARMAKAKSSKPMQNVYEPFVGDLVILYAEDTPRNIRYFDTEDLAKAGIAREDLRKLAIENLRRLVLADVKVKKGVISMVTAGGAYEVSLMLLDEVWARPELRAKGEIVVAVPARDLLLVTDSANADAVDLLRQFAARARNEVSHPLVDMLFVYRGGKFVPYDGRPPR